MAGEKQIVAWNDFRGGESGTLHGINPPANSFTGRNVVVYRDGSIGPRAGLKEVTPTGQSNGQIHAMGFTGITNNEWWYAQGTSVYQFGSARSAAYTGTFSFSPTQASAVFDNRYIMVNGAGLYRLDHANKTVTNLTATGAPTVITNARCVAVFGSRVFIGGLTSNQNRIRYSADADDTSWAITTATGSAGQFDVGEVRSLPGDEIRGLYPFREFLLIVKASGELWVLTTNGDPSTTGTLRRVSTKESGGGIFTQGRGAMTYGNEFWAVGMDSTAPQTYTGGRYRQPAPWLGSEVTGEFTEIGAWSSSMSQTDNLAPQYATVGLSMDTIAMVGNNRGLIRRNGTWTKHEFGVTIIGFAADCTVGGVILTDGGAVGAVPRFFWWNTADDRPPSKNIGIKGRDSIGDGSDTAPACDFTLPMWRDQQGRRVMVRSVTVHFRKYDTGVSATNHFDLTVRAEHGLDNSADVASATQSFDESQASGSVTGTRSAVRFGFGDQGYAEAFQLEFTNLRGVSINRVEALLETEPSLMT